jgi:hypothetical protein
LKHHAPANADQSSEAIPFLVSFSGYHKNITCLFGFQNAATYSSEQLKIRTEESFLIQ